MPEGNCPPCARSACLAPLHQVQTADSQQVTDAVHVAECNLPFSKCISAWCPSECTKLQHEVTRHSQVTDAFSRLGFLESSGVDPRNFSSSPSVMLGGIVSASNIRAVETCLAVNFEINRRMIITIHGCRRFQFSWKLRTDGIVDHNAARVLARRMGHESLITIRP